MTLTTGSKLAHYQITAKIGEGGMGIVYKAKDSHLDRFVAIKVLPPERVSDPTRKARFVQEAKAASALNHPNIITIYDIDQQDGVDFMVMEYIPGKTLDEMIPRKGMKLSDALKYAVQISDALAKAHSAGIIHRDLKPGNVMVSDDGHVKVLDFGLAKLTEAAPIGEDEATRTLPTTDEGMIVGTVAYMSPEQAEGKRVDARSDIFSFGSVLYEMVTGGKAFQTDTKTSTLAAIIHKEPEPLGAEIPHDLEKIIKRCLQKDTARRYQHMDDLKIALQELKEESESGKLGATQAAGAIASSKGIADLIGKKFIYIFAGLLVLALAYFLVDKYYLKRPSVEPQQVPAVSEVEAAPKTIAVLPFENMSSDPEQEYFVDGLSEELLNCLAKINGLKVTSRTSSFAFKNTDKTLQEVAGVLGVEHILEGSVRKAGDALRITAQLIRVKDDSHLWSKIYDRELKDIFEVQEDIATTVADELMVTLGISTSPLEQLGGTNNVEAYRHYLIAKGLYSESKDELAGESIDAAIALDPNFALAWNLKSQIYSASSFHVSADDVSSMRDASLQAAQTAIEIEPNLASGYISLAYTNSIRGNYLEAGSAYRKAFEITTYQSADPNMVSVTHFLAVDFIDKVNEIVEEGWKNDPFNQSARAWYITSLAYLGEMKLAEEEFELGRSLFGDDWFGNIFITIARLCSGDVVSQDKILMSDSIFDTAKKFIGSPEEGLAELKQIYTQNDNLSAASLVEILIWAAYFNDPKFALECMEKAVIINAESISYFWFPIFRETRQLPRFKEFIRGIGLVDYWNKFGWPDICHQLDGGDFACD